MQKLKILLGFDIWEAGFWGFCWEIRVKESWFERKFPWQWVSVLGYVHAQFIFNGLNLYLGSQLICIMGFEFPTMGNPLLGDPIARSCFRELLTFFSQSCSPHYWYRYSFLSRIANPHFSLYSPIYSLRWVEVLCYFLISVMWMGVQFHRF